MQGLTPEQAAERFYILDANGLVTSKRGAALPDNVRPYARHEEDLEGLRLEDVVKHVRPAHRRMLDMSVLTWKPLSWGALQPDMRGEWMPSWQFL